MQDSSDAGAPYVTGASADPCGADAPIIEFEGASTEIAQSQAQLLRELVACLTVPPYERTTVVLVGHTDVIGSASANLELGLARAQVVMRQLMGDGLPPGRIIVASAGELQRPHARWGLRAPRVEILIARGGPVRPNEAPIARGIDAEGLIKRKSDDKSSPVRSASPPQPSAVRRASPSVQPAARKP